MLPYRDSRFTKIVLAAFFFAVLGYAYFEGRGLLYGPSIEVDNRVMEVSDPFIAIEGVAKRIATLSMNGRTIPVTEEGAFAEAHLLAPGYNRITLVARDRYGKTTERTIEIVYTPKDTSQAPVAQ
ncbi:hypothetical protein A3C21_02390 [Candidatus Kaiserbacteria bacterium RIFCSPHIGHO2_02_FULL_59_21]|uniref:Peptidoglycan-binding lysin domain protein n=2 Tax=Candidatus Kaiseribacteriota TaxID=1752734 RepID=A0A0G1YQM6_9BACT|nr:MAG: Peptidoglycan-binding lysin domain protein [Candidatus Kaiserbacteria bacterium GW2011_GWA2_58_9]OGG62873.1 MAG: hypothetical protein A2766_04200 [Candidatus Kaiserbacteria bacterium RIFCSPHIGHO2_01_FULL_58_22]OGG67084.1 MAG: hypothetical protein A3C21_02390 [Candidatus Kaiserbacteria bacterium RIFCSPHIGHO2_02_FULL_59_21]OGG79459.1 MAG: hypothetical protein A2952_00135 [Candidatus Kaiserbacteria bacterium RIFCSPLOWO2_01_FULL_59_34]OGG86849.1 MAG: hypothetical protein A3I47_04255 [Candid